MTQWTIERLGRKGDGVALSGDARALAPLVLPGEVVEGEARDDRIARVCVSDASAASLAYSSDSTATSATRPSAS